MTVIAHVPGLMAAVRRNHCDVDEGPFFPRRDRSASNLTLGSPPRKPTVTVWTAVGADVFPAGWGVGV